MTKFGRKKVHDGLSDGARARIKTAIEANEGKIKATFRVSIGNSHADMRIDMAGEVGRGSEHGGARVPHAQIGPFMMMRVVKGGQQKLVPFTPSFDAIELTSEMVEETISDNGSSAQIDEDSALYLAIEASIGRAVIGSRGWPKMLFTESNMRPVIEFIGFASG